MDKLGLIGARQTAADLAVLFYNTLRGEIIAMTNGILDASEVEQTAVSAALDTFSALVSDNPDAQEALTEGIVRLMAVEFHRVGDSYPTATAKLLKVFEASWLALDAAKVGTNALPGLPSRAEIEQRVAGMKVEGFTLGLDLARDGNRVPDSDTPRREFVSDLPHNRLGAPAVDALGPLLDTEAMALGDPPLFCMCEQANGDPDFRCVDPARCTQAECLSHRDASRRHEFAAAPYGMAVVDHSQTRGRVLDRFGVSHSPSCGCVDGSAIVGARCDCGALEQ